MKFKLIIDKEKEEEVVATVHDRTALIDEIEALLQKHAGTDRIPGYTEEEKLQICKRHLVPKQIEAHGLPAKSVRMADKVLRQLIETLPVPTGRA